MTHSDIKKDEKLSGGKSALADLPPVDRNDQQRTAAASDDLNDEELNDTTSILFGAKAITGKAVYSANQVIRNNDQSSVQQANNKEHEAEERKMRELLRMAAWDAQKTLVGGVEMTNEEAQKCRQYIIDHDEEFAERAVKEGRISSDEKDKYKWAVRRIQELEEKKRAGTISGEELKECERVKHSREGRAAQDDTGGVFNEAKDFSAAHKANEQDARYVMRETKTAIPDNTMFQSAPVLNNHFEDAKAATTPLDQKPTAVTAPPSPRVSGMGVGV